MAAAFWCGVVPPLPWPGPVSLPRQLEVAATPRHPGLHRKASRLFEIARVLVRFNHVASVKLVHPNEEL